MELVRHYSCSIVRTQQKGTSISSSTTMTSVGQLLTGNCDSTRGNSPSIEDTAKACVIGHPSGGALTFFSRQCVARPGRSAWGERPTHPTYATFTIVPRLKRSSGSRVFSDSLKSSHLGYVLRAHQALGFNSPAPDAGGPGCTMRPNLE